MAGIAMHPSPAGSEPSAPGPQAFVHAEGRTLVRNGEPVRLKSVSFSNYYAYAFGEDGFSLDTSSHHTEEDFARVRALGFNAIRFALNGNWSRENPDAFWRWLDRNVAWAKRHEVLLTLDLHVPIGGFWLDPGDPKVDFSLWTDETLRTANVDLWRSIAARYRDEPIIAGYELLNEAVTVDDTGDQYRSLVADMVAAIRAVDPNHLLIVGPLYGTGGRYTEMGPDAQFLVDDPNVMYDFHFYEPIAFTHQAASWLDHPIADGGSYPDEVTPIPTGRAELLDDDGIGGHRLDPGTTGWRSYEGRWQRLENPRAVAGLPIAVMRSGAGGTAWFDDLVVTERDAETGETRQLAATPLTAEDIHQWYGWSDTDPDGASPAFARDTTTGANDTASLRITGTATTDGYLGWSSDDLWFRATPGNFYRITGQMRGDDVAYPGADPDDPGFIGFELNFYADPDGIGFLYRDRTYLEAEFMKLYRFGPEHDVPISVMEFGTMRDTLENPDKGGAAWISDMLDIYAEHDVSFSLWNYHGPSMGLYLSEDGSLPAEPNAALVNVLKAKLAGRD